MVIVFSHSDFLHCDPTANFQPDCTVHDVNLFRQGILVQCIVCACVGTQWYSLNPPPSCPLQYVPPSLLWHVTLRKPYCRKKASGLTYQSEDCGIGVGNPALPSPHVTVNSMKQSSTITVQIIQGFLNQCLIFCYTPTTCHCAMLEALDKIIMDLTINRKLQDIVWWAKMPLRKRFKFLFFSLDQIFTSVCLKSGESGRLKCKTVHINPCQCWMVTYIQII